MFVVPQQSVLGNVVSHSPKISNGQHGWPLDDDELLELDDELLELDDELDELLLELDSQHSQHTNETWRWLIRVAEP